MHVGDLGGIIGKCEVKTDSLVKIQYCYNSGTVKSSASQAGGICGNCQNSVEIYYCYNQGNITGTYFVGGIIGYDQGALQITYVYNDGAIYATDEHSGKCSYSGGIIGCLDSQYQSSSQKVVMRYACNAGKISAKYQHIAGICGASIGKSARVSLSYVYNSGDVVSETGMSVWGAIVGFAQYTDISDGYYASNLNKYVGHNYSNNNFTCAVKTPLIIPNQLLAVKNYFK